MKKIFISLICFAFSINGWTQIKHPSLVFTDQVVQTAQKAIKNNKQMADDWDGIQKKADSYLNTMDLAKTDYLALAYRMTNDKKYSDQVKKILLNAVKAESWAVPEMVMRNPAWHTELQVAHRSFSCAISYDAIYNTLSLDERKAIAEGLQRLAVMPAMSDWVNDDTRIHCLNSMGHNWWSSCVCMGGLLAMSLENEIPTNKAYVTKVLTILPEWFDFAGDVLQHNPKSFDRNGGQYESINYANFGIQEAALFLMAYHNAYPSKTLPDIPQLKQASNYFYHTCYPRTGDLWSINFGDSHKNITAESSLEPLYALGICTGNNALWYFNQVQNGQNRDGFFRDRPMGFLYMPNTQKAPATPKLKNSELFPDFGIATIRDSWEKDATMLAVKSGFTWNHSHADANSFILFHKGYDLLKDAGNCFYGSPDYRNYFFQSQAHNVVLFNGKGQSMEQQYHGSPERGYLYDLLDADNIKYILADGTGPVSDNFSRNFRHLLWWDNVIYVIDDLKTHSAGKFEWLWHPGGTYKKNGSDIEITKENASITLRPLYPQTLIPSGFLQDYPDNLTMEEIEAPSEDGGKEKYISLKFPKETDQIKGVTAIILKDSANQRDMPSITRRQGENWIGLRIEYKDKVTDLYINQLADGRLMHCNSWITADGWTTDAYMFGVSYRKGADTTKPHELFICYGSSLRRDNALYFSSLSKLFVIQKQKGDKAFIWADGQPKMHFSIKTSSKPSALMINEKAVDFDYNKGICTIE